MKTAWFMRIRILKAIYNDSLSFQVRGGCGVEIDGIYLKKLRDSINIYLRGGSKMMSSNGNSVIIRRSFFISMMRQIGEGSKVFFARYGFVYRQSFL